MNATSHYEHSRCVILSAGEESHPLRYEILRFTQDDNPGSLRMVITYGKFPTDSAVPSYIAALGEVGGVAATTILHLLNYLLEERTRNYNLPGNKVVVMIVKDSHWVVYHHSRLLAQQ